MKDNLTVESLQLPDVASLKKILNPSCCGN